MKLLITTRAIPLFFILTVVSCSQAQVPNEEISIETKEDTLVEQVVQNKIDTIRHKLNSIQEALDLFEELNYTHTAWEKGIREIPSLYVMKISENWRNKTSMEISTKLKKQIFFRVIAPLALHANDLIRIDRERILILKDSTIDWRETDEQWIRNMGLDYKLKRPENLKDKAYLNELLKRVNEISISLILAQSAEESGWGTSRFAAEGNALFGQWAWGKDAMKPKEQRPGMGNYGLAKFNSPQESMISYMHNLNSHAAYDALREKRFEMEQKGEKVTGWDLASTLIHYSERGEEYVKTLHGLMSYNHLEQTDDAYLKRNPVILIEPIE